MSSKNNNRMTILITVIAFPFFNGSPNNLEKSYKYHFGEHVVEGTEETYQKYWRKYQKYWQA